MVGYEQNFKNAIDYATHKTTYRWWKLILLGLMGSFYVGIGYIGFIYIISLNQDWQSGVPINQVNVVISGWDLALAAAVFPVGLLLIIFLGGSLFTSDNLTSIAVLTKKARVVPVVRKWVWTLLGNIIGAFIIACIVRGGAIFGEKELRVLSFLVWKKSHAIWWNVFFSGILCNVLVAGTVWATLATKHSIAKIFLIYFPIWLFAIIGFHHVVANVILFAFAWLHADNPLIYNLNAIYDSAGNIVNTHEWFSLSQWSFNAVFTNAIPAMIGNWLSGSIFLPYIYFWLSGYHKKMQNYKKHNCIIVENKCTSHPNEKTECFFRENSQTESDNRIMEENKQILHKIRKMRNPQTSVIITTPEEDEVVDMINREFLEQRANYLNDEPEKDNSYDYSKEKEEK
ncbi:MAG: formate/nitrite transporter family protein [Metamycoplasmataceae bacterium]